MTSGLTAHRTRVRIYCSEQAHSSVDKAVILLGLGHHALRKIPVDDQFRMRAEALRDAIAADRAAGVQPIAVVATIGTTSTTSVDPVADVAAICRAEGMWLHVDAAYAGVTAIIPEYRRQFDGWEGADSVVVNPHKWLFTPFDLSAFYCRRMDVVRQAFSLVPEYLKTAEAARGARNLMDTGIQLGRRFRSLKLWMILRHFGAEGSRNALAEHIRLAQLFSQWVDADRDFERLAPVPFSVVCFRARPAQPGDERSRARRAQRKTARSASTRLARFFCRTRDCNDRLRAAPCRRSSAHDRASRRARVEAPEDAYRTARRADPRSVTSAVISDLAQLPPQPGMSLAPPRCAED